MKYETLPKKVLFLWECAAIICIAVIMVITLIIFQPHTIVWYLLLWSIGAVAVFFLFLFLPLAFVSTKYVILTEQVILQKGVIFHRVHYLKRETISFISVYKNPFTNLLNLSTLIISAPGARIFIPLMNHKRALLIAKRLSYQNHFQEA